MTPYHDAVIAALEAEPWPPVPAPCRKCGEPLKDHPLADGRPVLPAPKREMS